MDPGALVVAHVSDLHIGAHFPGLAQSLVADVVAAQPDLTVCTGDLTMRAKPAQFVEAEGLLNRLPRPLLVVIGNHDVPLAPLRRLRAPYAAYEAALGPELDPAVDLPGLRALGLNSMPRWRWKSGRVSARQARRVTDVLGGAPAGAVRLLAVHHPVSAQGLARVVGRDALLHALTQARVDVVLAGHTHVPAIGRLTDPANRTGPVVLEVTAGTATSRRVRGAGCSWNLVRIDADTFHVETRRHTPSGWLADPVARFPRSGG